AAPGADAPPLRAALAWIDEAPLLHGELLATARWLARYLHAPLGEVLATALPAALRRGEPLSDTTAWGRALTAEGRDALAGLRAGGRPRRLADLLHDGPRAGAAPDAPGPGWPAAARSLAARRLPGRVGRG